MSLENTRFTLILGAGASADFGFPLGDGLRENIARDLDIKFDDFGQRLKSGSYEIVDALREVVRDKDGRSGDINPHRKAAVQISEAMPYSSSIDEYIERHSDNELKAQCAKLAIGKAILEKERSSSLYGDPRNPSIDPLRNASNTWLASFLRDITRGLPKARVGVALQEFSIINFNYDRCLEHFVYHWLCRIYEFQPSEAADVVQSMSIFHPYGKLGDLPFESPNSHIAFGEQVDRRALLLMMGRIRTYSETMEEDAGLSAALERMSAAKKFVFIGFGFHRQNMEILRLRHEYKLKNAKCFATTVKIPNTKWEIFQQRLAHVFGIDQANLFVERNSVGCGEFWSEFGETIIA